MSNNSYNISETTLIPRPNDMKTDAKTNPVQETHINNTQKYNNNLFSSQ